LRRSLSAFILCMLPLVANAEPDDVARLQKNMPGPVTDLISRIVNCNHWTGEDAYDTERKAQIERAVSELRCAELETDEGSVLKKYDSDPSVLKAIEAAKEIFL
jgi:hypothetical protein